MNIQLPQFKRLVQFSSLKSKKKTHVNPRFRAYGRARIDIIQHVSNQDDWDRLWKSPSNNFPFEWTEGWKQCLEYRVDDYAAEVGFFIDFLGFSVDEFGPQYARFCSPADDFAIGIEACPAGSSARPVSGLRLQLQVTNLFELVEELQKRGVSFEHPPKINPRDKTLVSTIFKSPHGLVFELISENRYPELEVPVELARSSYETDYNEKATIATEKPDLD